MKKIEGILSNKKFQIALLISYCLLILYFLFFAFNRVERSGMIASYRYSFELKRIPLWFPKENKITRLWIFGMGNLIAFIPLGILIPKIFNLKLLGTMVPFIFSITTLEVLQMLTHHGSFDVEDILVNSIGIFIGYISLRIGSRFKRNKIFKSLLLILFFVVSSILLAEIINQKYF